MNAALETVKSLNVTVLVSALASNENPLPVMLLPVQLPVVAFAGFRLGKNRLGPVPFSSTLNPALVVKFN